MWEGSGLTCLPVRVLFVFLSSKSIKELGGLRSACGNQLQGHYTVTDGFIDCVLLLVVEKSAVV